MAIYAVTAIVAMLQLTMANGQNLKPEVIASSGGSGSSSSSTLNWTIGQPIINTYASNTNTLSNGFMQGSLSVTGITPLGTDNFKVSVYPNPTQESITIAFEDVTKEKLKYNITSLDGKVVFNSIPLTSNQQTANLQTMNSGTYILSIYNEKQILLSFQIIKQN